MLLQVCRAPAGIARDSVAVLRRMNWFTQHGGRHLSPVSEATPTPLASSCPPCSLKGTRSPRRLAQGLGLAPALGLAPRRLTVARTGRSLMHKGLPGHRRQNPPGTQSMPLLHAQTQGTFCLQLPREVSSIGETRACLPGCQGETGAAQEAGASLSPAPLWVLCGEGRAEPAQLSRP